MKKVMMLVASFAIGCSTFKIKQDAYDNSKIIEYEFSKQDAGDGSSLHFLSSKFQKATKPDNNTTLKLFIHAIGNTNRTMKVDSTVTFKINEQEFQLQMVDENSTINQRVKVNKKKEVVETGIAFLNVYGEIDLNSIKEKLQAANSIVVRFKRENNSAVFVYTEEQINNIKQLIAHTGAE